MRKHFRLSLPFAIVLTIVTISIGASAGTWSSTADMQTTSGYNSAVRLQDGRVLVVSSTCWNCPSTAETYDPGSGTWTRQADLNRTRFYQTMTLLSDGRVLVAGGEPTEPRNSSEIFDPATGAWTLTGNLSISRRNAQAVLLADGRVLVAGGFASAPSRDAEIYDPGSGVWTVTGSMTIGRAWFGMTPLRNATILVAGGWPYIDSSELFDPSTGRWRLVGNMSQWSNSPLQLLLDGRVLVVHGHTADLYDPDSESWRRTVAPRGDHVYTALSDDCVLGSGSYNGPVSSEIFDPLTETWQETVPMQVYREFHSATLQDDGRVLVAGGGNWGPPCDPEGGCTFYALKSAEIFTPDGN